MPQTIDALLDDLESAKDVFGGDAASRTRRLLDRLEPHEFRDAKRLIRFHETLLFLRAFPQATSLVPKIERLLNTFHERIEKLRVSGVDMSAFDDFDTSGIAGTTMRDTLSFQAARWLAHCIPQNVEIAWDDFWDDPQAERAVGSTWPRFIPLLEEDSDVEANIPWRRWLDAARGRERDLEWLIRRFEQLSLSDRERAELYDSLRLPLRWHLKNLKLSRTRNWFRPRRFYIHEEPLISRRQVSLESELAQPAPPLTKLSRREGESVMDTIREVMAVRYRELYGTTLGDPTSVVRAEPGRGIVIHLWNLPPGRRLPFRAYVAGFTLKNGVPINYVEAIGLCEWIEVGFNTFYTYRQGETAWIYAQVLRCLTSFAGATTISVYPYQIGQNNDEALDSGAFWFYRKLGFRCGRPDLEELARREEEKIAANREYRTPRRTLKRLAEAHVFYEVKERPLQGRVKGLHDEPGFSLAVSAGPWDTFSTRNIALRVNRRMARECGGDDAAIREASIKYVARALRFDPRRWTPSQRHTLENWSLILALIPDLLRWSAQEKQDLIKIIQSQSAPDEMRYLRLTQVHPRLRRALLRLGSTPPEAASD
jgi:hypothetical protein